MLNTNIKNLNLITCIYNASGPKCTTMNELLELSKNDDTAIILTKSCTLNVRAGNSQPRYYETEDATINSTGLCNMGYQSYIDFANISHKIYQKNSNKRKPYFISVSGLSLDDNLKILKDIQSCLHVNGIELNLSCPNVIGKPQIGYDFPCMDNILNKVFEQYDPDNKDLIFGLKLPPYFDLQHYETVSDILLQYSKIDYITCINSLGNGIIIDSDNDSTVIKPKNGLGGIGGKIVKPIALANVSTFYRLLDDKIDIIGCGGISTGRDAYEHILCGAKVVQIGSQFSKEGHQCFTRISQELKNIMKEKGHENVENFRGKLKYI